VITSFCDTLRRSIKDDIEARRDHLERGMGVDERHRGEIYAMRRVLDMIDDLESRARRQENGDDML
jgi:hypothetical protein